MARSWVAAIRAAGVVPAAYVPEASLGRPDDEVVAASVVEDSVLRAHPVTAGAWAPPAACFLDGIQHWRVVGQSGVAPVVQAYVAAAVRRRGPDRRPRTLAVRAREFVITHLAALPAAARRALADSGVDVVDLRAAHVRVDRAREALEHELAEACLAALGPDEWLVVDGLLSDTAAAAHPRAVGVIKSHGTQFFSGAELECALTLPAGHRTSVFRPESHAHRPVYSWYLRLWPWEGNDVLYSLLRVEARAHPDTVRAAPALAAWLAAERAPLAAPDARWDRLLYPIHDVETYLRSRMPRELVPAPGSRLPKTGT